MSPSPASANSATRKRSCTRSKPTATRTAPTSLPSRQLDRVLYACDELSGLIYACCLVRPNGIDDLKPKSVVKKMKDKSFAAGVHRDAVKRGIELIGLPRNEHVQNVIDGLRTVAGVLEVRGEDQKRRWAEKLLKGKGKRDYAAEYSDKSFWKKLEEVAEKVRAQAVRAGRAAKSGKAVQVLKSVVEKGLVLYCCLQDARTSKWAKTVIMGALGYLVLPVDLIPDVLPGVGQLDDLAVLAAAVALVLAQIRPEHKLATKEKMKKWFGTDGSA